MVNWLSILTPYTPVVGSVPNEQFAPLQETNLYEGSQVSTPKTIWLNPLAGVELFQQTL